MWAVLPPVAIIVVEEIVLGTRHFAALMRERLIGVFPQAFTSDTGRHQLAWKYQDENANVDLQFSDGVLGIIDPGNILTSPGLWSGLIVAGLFFAAAVWMRRYRDDS